MHFVEKGPMVSSGILNAIWANEVAASFTPNLPGDRAVYDFLVSCGQPTPDIRPLGDAFKLPNFSAALWPDVVAIRRDSAALGAVRAALKDAAGTAEEAALPAIRERLQTAAEGLAREASLWKATRGTVVSFGVGLLGGPSAAALVGRTSEEIAAWAATAFGSSLAGGLLSQAFSPERRARVKSAELVTRILDRT
jgi:hypothetical protein